MLVWLDSNSNVLGRPNENYARELMELFSLGVGNYTETDVREAARAFTGWHTDGDGFTFAARLHDVASPLVVEWRSLTVALLDRLAGALRQRLGLDAVSLPLAKVLEGGTWAAGRRLAREKREGGAPPLSVVSDGTVF